MLALVEFSVTVSNISIFDWVLSSVSTGGQCILFYFRGVNNSKCISCNLFGCWIMSFAFLANSYCVIGILIIILIIRSWHTQNTFMCSGALLCRILCVGLFFHNHRRYYLEKVFSTVQDPPIFIQPQIVLIITVSQISLWGPTRWTETSGISDISTAFIVNTVHCLAKATNNGSDPPWCLADYSG